MAAFLPQSNELVRHLRGEAQLEGARGMFAMLPWTIARTIVFAIEQPADMDVGETIVRPTAQG